MNGMSRAEVESALTQIWSDVLQIPADDIGVDANFFSLGGDSLLIARVMDRVNARYFEGDPDLGLPVAQYFASGTIQALARAIVPPEPGVMAMPADAAGTDALGIAIIGLAGRFPGADDVESFWNALANGRELLRPLSDADLDAAGVTREERQRPDYVKCAGLINDIQSFDAEYFGLTPREAALTSPEQRLLIECSESALQDAGYDARDSGAAVGVFLGTGLSNYLLGNLAPDAGLLESTEGMRLVAANSGAATRVSFLLDLTGPSVTVDTACSSSLVAIHLACRALLNGECQMALAGGATVRRFEARGYRVEAGGIFSPDGHCRPFDRDAQGTIGSSGAGVVLLKRLDQARADGDVIHAVIRGTAVNNDGGSKAGYTAPSLAGQAGVIRAALAAAHVDAAEIQYLESHGTATALGDQIELAALENVFGASAGRSQRCALGTLKANIGHLEAAAGVASLIKATLALKHRQIPPAIHFRHPALATALDRSAFFLNTELENWPATAAPRRAGVSSFGIGGTNAHAILEEEPHSAPREIADSGPQLLVLSARSQNALRGTALALARRIESVPALRLGDIAATLQLGRKAHPVRHFLVASSVAEAAHRLRELATTSEITVPAVSTEDSQAMQDLHAIGLRWRSGAGIDWQSFNAPRQFRRVALPTYPFERRRYWIEPKRESAAAAGPAPTIAAPVPALKRAALAHWFYTPAWKQKPLQASIQAAAANPESEGCLLFEGREELNEALERRFTRAGFRVVRVRADDDVSQAVDDCPPVVTCVIDASQASPGAQDVACVHRLMNLLRALLDRRPRKPLQLTLVTENAFEIGGSEACDPFRAMLSPILRTLSKEAPHIGCRAIDLSLPDDAGRRAQLLERVAEEVVARSDDDVVAFRGASRWVRVNEHVVVGPDGSQSSLLRHRGVYLITGGLGGVGWALAETLARTVQARLVLVGRSPVPDRSEWNSLPAGGDEQDERFHRIRAIRELESLGAEILVVQADVASKAGADAAISAAIVRFGELHGVIHSAGVAAGGLISLKSRESIDRTLAAKVDGTRHLHAACERFEPDFFLCCSSLAAVLSPLGQSDYSAANAFQDAFCEAHDGRSRTRFISINWDAWKDVGMAVTTAVSARMREQRAGELVDAIICAEGAEVFRRVLSNPSPRWIVCTHELGEVDTALRGSSTKCAAATPAASVATVLANIWKDLLGVEASAAEDDFFDLGGDSLLAVQLRTRLESQFRRSVTLKELLTKSTLAGMTELLEASELT